MRQPKTMVVSGLCGVTAKAFLYIFGSKLLKDVVYTAEKQKFCPVYCIFRRSAAKACTPYKRENIFTV